MKFGICTGTGNLEAVKNAGFDYIELNLNALSSEDESTAAESLETLRNSGLKAEAMCVMLPGDLKISGPEPKQEDACEHLEKAFARAAEFGITVQVFGSGAARKAPEGFPAEKALEQVAEFLAKAAKIAAKYNIKIAIEPLNPKECNIINTVSDALKMQERVGDENIGVLADWYHMACQEESTEAMLEAGDRLLHCHIASAPDRKLPLPDDGTAYTEFFTALKKINYKNRLSIEAGGGPEDFEKSLNYIKSMVL